MGEPEEQDTRSYIVVRNDEEQYSVWLADKDLPAGWHPVGEPAPKSKCLEYIASVWTDMRPRSLREAMSK